MKNYIVSIEYMCGGNSGQYFKYLSGYSASQAVQSAMDNLKDEKSGVYSISLLNVERV